MVSETAPSKAKAAAYCLGDVRDASGGAVGAGGSRGGGSGGGADGGGCSGGSEGGGVAHDGSRVESHSPQLRWQRVLSFAL